MPRRGLQTCLCLLASSLACGVPRTVHSVHPVDTEKTISQIPSAYRGTLRDTNAFKSCAVVGSAGSLREKRQGAEIDQHDTVIRINRLPTKNFKPFTGTKVSVAYMNEPNFLRGTVMFLSKKKDNCTGGEDTCWESADCRRGGTRCNFPAMVFRGLKAEWSKQ